LDTNHHLFFLRPHTPGAPHFLTWKGSIEERFDGELEIKAMKTLFLSDDGWRQQKPGLFNW